MHILSVYHQETVWTEPLCNVQNSLMGASAYKYLLVVLFYEKILLVTKVIWKHFIINHHFKSETTNLKLFWTVIAGMKCKVIRISVCPFCDRIT